MTALACPRCLQVLTPGELAPFCLGGRYRCDPSRAVPVPAADRPDRPARSAPAPSAMSDAEVLADLRERGELEPSPRSLRNRYGMRHDRAVRLVAELADRADRSAGTGAVR